MRLVFDHENKIVNLPISLGHDEIVDLLTRNGANFEVVRENGMNLLHLASESGQYEKK